MLLSPFSKNKFQKQLFVLAGAILFVLALQLQAAASSGPGSHQPEVGRSASGVTFTWQLDQQQAEPQYGNGTSKVMLPGFIQNNAPGELVVPMQSHLVVLPDQGDPTITVVASRVADLELKQPLAQASIPAGVKTNADGAIIGGDYAPADDFVSPKTLSTVHFEELGRMGGVRLGRVTFSPIVYDQKSSRYQFVTSLTVQLNFGSAVDEYSDRVVLSKLTRLQTTLAGQVVNPELLGMNQSGPTRVNHDAQAVSPPRPNMILEITEPGLYEITASDVLAADANHGAINPAKWQLAKHGQPIDMHWIGDADAKFEAGERFLFFGAPDANRWSTSEFYTLTAGPATGSRMSLAAPPSAALPAGKLSVSTLFEKDVNYTPNCFCGHLPAGRDGDRWIWDELRLPGNPTGKYEIDLPDNDISPSAPAELTLWMIGFTNLLKKDDHVLNVAIDNTHLAEIIWDGKSAITQTVPIPAGVLTGSSELSLAIDGTTNSIDGVWLDAFEITYAKNSATHSASDTVLFEGNPTPHQYSINLAQSGWAFDVTAEDRPKIIGSKSTFVLKDEANGVRNYLVATEADIAQPLIRKAIQFSSEPADLLMIGPAEFESALSRLIALRARQGWTVDFIPLSEIYDSYGYGYPSPFAIQAALQDAYNSGSVKPEAVILVGDGTHDPKLNQPNGKGTLLPVMFADVDPWIGEIPADNRFATIDGDDVLPDLLIGRLPVNNLDELHTVISKLVVYPTQNTDWRKNITFVADNNDNAGQFSEFVATQFKHLDNGKHLLNAVQYSGSESDISQVKEQISERFETGNSHLIYIGHSTVHQWADESLMHISEVDALSNASRLPIILQMTCFTGSFHMAGLDSFDEALFRHKRGGAIGVWGATGLSVTTGHDSLADGYLEVLAAGNDPVVGAAIVAGKIKMMTDKPRHADLVDTYTFFGDPTLILVEPGIGFQNIFLPAIFNK